VRRIDGRQFSRALAELAEPRFWETDGLWSEVAGAPSNYRLSKFQPLMPSWVEKEVMARYRLIIDVTNHQFDGTPRAIEPRRFGLLNFRGPTPDLRR
jgi:hypothetical protein